MIQRYVLLPRSGLTAHGGPDADRLNALNRACEYESGAGQVIDGAAMRVIDATRNGPALVEMSEEAAAALLRAGLLRSAAEVVYPHPGQFALRRTAPPAISAADATRTVTVTCVDAHTGAPLRDAQVIAGNDPGAGDATSGYTDAAGHVRLQLPAGTPIRHLVVDTVPHYWGGYYEDLALQDHILRIVPVDLAADDVLRHYYPASEAAQRFDARTGVTVGIIDSGVEEHRDLTVVGGCCTVTGQSESAFGGVTAHGTHVAGLIGGKGALTAIAPGVKLRAYRVFPDARNPASNYAIVRAMIEARRDGCDIVNLSLGGGPHDAVVAEAIQDARNRGMLVVAAAGNDGSTTVNFPAASQGAIAVAALGHRGTFPPQSAPAGDIRTEPVSARDPDEFVAKFSNSGLRIDVIAPGVGVLSTLPGDTYGPLSGTSMAAPIVAGVAACLLSQDAELFARPRDRARSNALAEKLFASCVEHGFGKAFEGRGRPRAWRGA